MEEIIRVKTLSYAEELSVLSDLLLLLSHPNEVKEIWNRINIMNQTRFCCYIITSGERMGDMCGKQIKTNDPFCPLHNASYSAERQLQMMSTESKSSQGSTRSSLLLPKKAEEPSLAKKSESASSSKTQRTVIRDDDIIIHQNRFKNFVYPGTSLILDKDNIVVAREDERGEWNPLTAQDIRQAKRYKLRYRILPLEFKGEKMPSSLSSLLEQPYEERQNISEALQPNNLFVLKPKTNPDDLAKVDES
jgi:hypothetical protein